MTHLITPKKVLPEIDSFTVAESNSLGDLPKGSLIKNYLASLFCFGFWR
jgi:hypothetical protein